MSDDALIIVAKVWSFARQQNVHDNSQAPHISFFIVFLVVENFRSHVKWSADDLAQLLALCELSSSPKVYDLDNLILLQANILWLQIPVDESFFVQVIHRSQYLKHDLSRVFLFEFGSLDNFIEQLSTLQQVHDQIEVDLIFVDLVQLD